MAAAKRKDQASGQGGKGDRLVYSEFGSTGSTGAAFERAVPDLPPNQQQLKIEATRKGRKGKTVTVISGFQSSAEKLTTVLKTLKTQCGAGGTVKDNAIEIQGDHASKALAVLTDLGYKAKVSGRSG
ncbi:MAG: translation initiation factor [Synechococcales bacterium]|nr:translation initiation factor [Synechococcales bacterium]